MGFIRLIFASVFTEIYVRKLSILLKRFNIPTIIGYIFTGFAIAYLFELGRSNDSLTHIAEFGIVFLMFTI